MARPTFPQTESGAIATPYTLADEDFRRGRTNWLEFRTILEEIAATDAPLPQTVTERVVKMNVLVADFKAGNINETVFKARGETLAVGINSDAVPVVRHDEGHDLATAFFHHGKLDYKAYQAQSSRVNAINRLLSVAVNETLGRVFVNDVEDKSNLANRGSVLTDRIAHPVTEKTQAKDRWDLDADNAGKFHLVTAAGIFAAVKTRLISAAAPDASTAPATTFYADPPHIEVAGTPLEPLTANAGQLAAEAPVVTNDEESEGPSARL
jgi:hypothetical protein